MSPSGARLGHFVLLELYAGAAPADFGPARLDRRAMMGGVHSGDSLAPVVAPEWLAAHSSEVVIADVRWYLDGRSGLAAYEAGHIEGAVFVDLDHCLAGPAGAAYGRHPLPSPEVFAAAMGALGVGDESTVVAYDDAGGVIAARLVWLLRATGHAAALLDGGLQAWFGPVVPGPPPVAPPAVFHAHAWPHERLAGPDDVAGAPLVIDARAPERFRGEVEPVDSRPGHVPGAVNGPTAENLDARGRFRSAEALRRYYAALGVGEDRPPVVYCGSGVTACHDLIALELAGFAGARLYPGSWSQWSADPARPVATGA